LFVNDFSWPTARQNTSTSALGSAALQTSWRCLNRRSYTIRHEDRSRLMWVPPDVVGLFSINVGPFSCNAGPRHQTFSADLGPKPRMLSGPESYVLGPLHLVTGGSRAIGAAIAQRFLDAGVPDRRELRCRWWNDVALTNVRFLQRPTGLEEIGPRTSRTALGRVETVTSAVPANEYSQTHSGLLRMAAIRKAVVSCDADTLPRTTRGSHGSGCRCETQLGRLWKSV
jgi:hypothetical protein